MTRGIHCGKCGGRRPDGCSCSKFGTVVMGGAREHAEKALAGEGESEKLGHRMLPKLPLVYIAGPISQGDRFANLRSGFLAWEILIESKYCIPICPMLSIIFEIRGNRSHSDWMNYDLQLVKRCDAVVRLEGPSVGADEEESLAKSLDIPVFPFFPSTIRYKLNTPFYKWCANWTLRRGPPDA